MTRPPFSAMLAPSGEIAASASRTIRTLSALGDQFLDTEAVSRRLAQDDPVLYEVYHFDQESVAGDLNFGLTILHAGRVGQEYFMTKGHFHKILETAEVYYCLQGQGLMLMETPEGEVAVGEMTPGAVLYVPPRWAHRTVNTDEVEDLIFFFVYPSHAGHDYRTIEIGGFRKAAVATPDGPTLIDNPRWSAHRRQGLL